MNNKEIFDKFLKFENDNKYFDIEYKNIKIWEILRSYLYIDIEMFYNNLQPLFPKNTSVKRKQISLNIIKNSFKLFFIKNKDFIFLNNPRRVKQKDSKYYCIYTDLIIDTLKKQYSCVTLEDPYWSLSPTSAFSHFMPQKTNDICFLDFMEYIYRIKKIIFKKIYKKEYVKLHSIIIKLQKEIEKEFKCNLDNITKLAEEKVLYCLLLKSDYEKIINRIKPKIIFEFYDVFPSKLIINKIAKEKNIPIIEIQHGIVTKQNPIFLKYYDIERKYDCMPNYIFSFGKKLLQKNNMPIKSQNIIYIGNSFLNYKKNEYKSIKKDKKYILFISQSNLGEHISQFASNLADLLKENRDYKIIYKMHPYEIGNTYECLKKNNIIVINDREKDLYYYQRKSVAQVGVYSTGLYEGLFFNLNTYIIEKFYGVDEIKDILGSNELVSYVKTEKELYDMIIKKSLKPSKIVKSNIYWHSYSEEKLKEEVERILKTHLKV